MIYSVIVFFLALIPFLTIPGCGDGIRTPKEIASIVGLITIIALCQWQNRKPFKNKWLLLFWLWCFITTLFACKVPFIFGQEGGNIHFFVMQMPNGVTLDTNLLFLAWKELFYITLVVFAIASIASIDFPHKYLIFKGQTVLFRSHDKISLTNGIANTINWCIIIMGVYAIIQALGFDDFFSATNNMGLIANDKLDPRFSLSHRIVGVIGNPSLFATWVAMCLPFSLYLKNKKGLIGFVLGLIVLCLTWSATAILVAIITILFYLFFREIYLRKFIIIFLGVFFILAILLGIGYRTNPEIKKPISKVLMTLNPTGRIECHKEMWNILKNRPLLGIGLGSFEYLIGYNPEVVKKLNGEHWKELHNDIGQIWFSAGLIGFALFIMFIISVFVGFIRNISNEAIVFASSMVGFLVICLTLFPMRVGPTAFYGVVLTGLLMNITREES